MSIFRRLRSLFWAHFALKRWLFRQGLSTFLQIQSVWEAKLPKQIDKGFLISSNYKISTRWFEQKMVLSLFFGLF